MDSHDEVKALLMKHQSVAFVYPTHQTAHRRFLEATQRHMGPDISFHWEQSTIMRDNPDSRVPTAVRFMSASADPFSIRATKMIVAFPIPLASHHHNAGWTEVQAIMEMNRK